MNLQVQQNMNNQTTLQYKWSNQVTYGRPQEAMVQLLSWMIPAEACPGTFVTLKGACGKTTTTTITSNFSSTTQHRLLWSIDDKWLYVRARLYDNIGTL